MSDLTPEQELARAQEAERILTSKVFIEACNSLDSELRMLRERVPMNDKDMHSRLILAEQVQAKVLDYLRGLMQGGAWAAQQLALRESVSERLLHAAKYGLRNVF